MARLHPTRKRFAAVLLALMAACSGSTTQPSPTPADPDRGDGSAGGDPSGDPINAGDPTGTGDAATGDPSGGDVDPCAATLDEEITIPMRDSTAVEPRELAAFLRRPAQPGCQVPVILVQTPYDKESTKVVYFPATYDPDNPAPLPNPMFESTDYAFAFADWRGYYGSSGIGYDSLLPPFAEDGHDLVEWLAVQPWSDGKVGTWGASALCRQQHATAAGRAATFPYTAVDPPPHLEAAVPIFCEPALAQTYSVLFPGGVLRDEYAGALSILFGGVLRDALLHPRPGAFWTKRADRVDTSQATIPMLSIGGFYDLYTPGNIESFDSLRALAAPLGPAQRLLLGPWIHFATAGEGHGQPFDAEESMFIDPTREIQQASLAFFDRHLRNVASAADSWPAVRYRREGSPTWEGSTVWPPADASPVSYYLHADGSLALAAAAPASLGFFVDPNDPSPTVGGSTLWPTGVAAPSDDPAAVLYEDLRRGPRSQAAVLAHVDDTSNPLNTAALPQGRVWTSAPLTSDLRIAGHIRVELGISTDAPDTDIAVRLTDVDEDGDHRMLSDGVSRLKYRTGLTTPTLATPGEPYVIAIDLIDDLAYTFAASHRVGLIVTASDYPRFARNPNTGDDFFPEDYYYVVLRPSVAEENAVRQQLDATVPKAAVNHVHVESSRLVLPVQ